MANPPIKPLASKVAEILDGAVLNEVQRLDHSGVFGFNSASLTVETLWRMITAGEIAFSDQDHGHQFGLPEPMDVEARARAMLVGQYLAKSQVGHDTSDLLISFASGPRLEIISASAGYEAWQLYGSGHALVGRGGRLSEAREIRPGLMIGGAWE